MAGVSVTESTNIDLDAIVAGGDAFIARIKQLQDAKAKNEAALDSLNLGRDVAAAMADAQVREAAAIKAVEDAKLEAEQIVASAKAEAATITKEANASAASLMAFAKQGADGLDAQVVAARRVLQDWSDKTTAEANSLMASASATKAAADKQLADSQLAAKQLADTQAQAEAALKTTQAAQAALNAKLDAIKAAAS